jgi:16S rRNA processing protein RimM
LKNPDLVALGKILRSQGRDGHLKLRLIEKGLPGFSGGTIYLRRSGGIEAFAVESLTLDRNSHFLKLKGIDTLAEADALAGLEVFVAEADFRRLERDRFYDFQVLGCRVVTRDGAEVGEVTGILPAGGQVRLVVRRGNGDVYVPFTEAICLKVDPEAKEIVIDPPAGLLELNEN